MAPIWEELGHKIKEGVNIGSVDCTVHKSTNYKLHCLTHHLDACKKFQVQGYPTVMFINGDFKENYSGARTLNALEEFAQNLPIVGTAIQNQREKTLFDFNKAIINKLFESLSFFNIWLII